jgi:hypothetical protein
MAPCLQPSIQVGSREMTPEDREGAGAGRRSVLPHLCADQRSAPLSRGLGSKVTLPGRPWPVVAVHGIANDRQVACTKKAVVAGAQHRGCRGADDDGCSRGS